MNTRALLSVAALVLVCAVPAHAQEDIGFKPVPGREIKVGAFTDSDVDARFISGGSRTGWTRER